jgi:hypothetical protein
MAEQSSSVVAFRALIILICLVLVPVAAFCGSSYPAVVKAIQSGRWPALADFHNPSTPGSQGTEAPRYQPNPSADPNRTVCGPFGCETSRSPVVPITYNAPIGTPVLSGSGRSTSFPPKKDADGAIQKLFRVPGEENSLSTQQLGVPARFDVPVSHPSTSVSLPPGDQLNYVLDRLRQLGATYYLLETCGNEKREFRFYCKMAVGGNRGVTQPFWCIDSEPLKAMTAVLQQVQDWQSGGGKGPKEM